MGDLREMPLPCCECGKRTAGRNENGQPFCLDCALKVLRATPPAAKAKEAQP